MQNDREKFTQDNIRIYDKLRGRLIYLNKKSTKINPHILESKYSTLRKIRWLPSWGLNLYKENRAKRLNYKRKRLIMHYSLQSNF